MLASVDGVAAPLYLPGIEQQQPAVCLRHGTTPGRSSRAPRPHQHAQADLPPCSKTRHRFWFENPTVARPIREEGGSLAAGGDQRLFPRECREAVRVHRVGRVDGPASGLPALACRPQPRLVRLFAMYCLLRCLKTALLKLNAAP